MMHRLLTTALFAGLVSAPVGATDLDIEVRGIRSGDGQVLVAIHGAESRASFPSGPGAARVLGEPARTGTLRFVARDLAPGLYAVSAFHDENGNGELDTNLVGIPTEGYGFGNNASGVLGPPGFEAAAVTVGEAPAASSLTLNY